MIEHQSRDHHEDTYEVTCDEEHCCFSEEVSTFDFREMIRDLIAEGWKCEKRDGEWWHTCPSCAQVDAENDFEPLKER